MKLAMMQPYFFPYLGYLRLISLSDSFVIFDTAQFIRHGWINRNRVLHPKNGWLYLIVPLERHARETMIKDVRIADGHPWRQRILGQLQHYKRKAPYFGQTFELVREGLALQTSSIAELNVHVLKLLCSHLGLSFNWQVFSEMSLSLGPVAGPGDWALRVAEALGAAEYINPIGGKELFNRASFKQSGIELSFLEERPLQYELKGYTFEPNLSIIDVLMWNSPEQVRRYLEKNQT
jgi:hypothetical protein